MRFKTVLRVGAVAAALGSSFVFAHGASASVTCTNTPINAQAITGTLIVPAGVWCQLNNSSVTGGVSVAATGKLTAIGSSIGGAVTGNGAELVLENSSAASYSATKPVSEFAGATSGLICGSTVGSVLYTGAPTATKSFVLGGNSCTNFGLPTTNTIHGSVSVTNNQLPAEIFNNTIDGTLGCSGNVPAPTGGGNSASSKTGQCSAF